MIETISLAVLAVGCLIAAYIDFKTGLIPDYLTYPMIAVGAIASLLTGQIVIAGIQAAWILGIGYALYYTGRLGGGDVKLFAAIALLKPTFQGLPFIAIVVLAASLMALIFFSGYYAYRLVREKKINLRQNRMRLLIFGAGMMAILAYLYWMVGLRSMHAMQAFVLGLALSMGLFFTVFERAIKEEFFVRWIAVGRLEEGDVVAAEFMAEKQKKQMKMGKTVLEENDIKRLKKTVRQKLPIYRGLPKFGPFIGLAVLALIADPGILAWIFPNWPA